MVDFITNKEHNEINMLKMIMGIIIKIMNMIIKVVRTMVKVNLKLRLQNNINKVR